MYFITRSNFSKSFSSIRSVQYFTTCRMSSSIGSRVGRARVRASVSWRGEGCTPWGKWGPSPWGAVVSKAAEPSPQCRGWFIRPWKLAPPSSWVHALHPGCHFSAPTPGPPTWDGGDPLSEQGLHVTELHGSSQVGRRGPDTCGYVRLQPRKASNTWSGSREFSLLRKQMITSAGFT